jgi:hypothetical protein
MEVGRLGTGGDLRVFASVPAHTTASPARTCRVGMRELRPCLVRKIFQDFPSHRILRYMHEALNIDENKN